MKNIDRVQRIENVIQFYAEMTGDPDDKEFVMRDILADLMHWADVSEQYFEAELEAARSHHTYEKECEA